ncbi:ribonuclease E/G [Enterocloster sp. OA13]|uniref:ribonuclease E/G n=1 Tax=Enterocloster sp. OA13 TaxID=2914161 RepID=UPI001F05E6AB|nr:ribonuclease E/G [Enterocloster sp. OA13]
MDRLIVTQLNDRVCTAAVSGSRITQLMMEPEDSSSLLNNIYIGKVQKVVGNINAAFVDIGGGRTGYYSLDENKEHLFVSPSTGKLKAGDEIVVQVSRDAVKTKAPVLTGKLAFTGRYCVLTAGKTGVGFSNKIGDNKYKARVRSMLNEALAEDGDRFGIIVRTNGAGAADEVLLQEYRQLKDMYLKLSKEASCRTCYSCIYRALPGYIAAIRDSYSGTLDGIVTDIPAYYEELKDYLEEYQAEDADKLTLYEDKLLPLSKLYSLDSALEHALNKHVWLKSGGYLVIEPTEAMVVIDVNTGKYSGKKKMQDTICRINMEAADEIGRQLRLRNLSGIILIDFIDMEREEDREMLMRHLGDVVSKDPVKTTVVDMTRLNLVEVTRKKVRKPLYEQV